MRWHGAAGRAAPELAAAARLRPLPRRARWKALRQGAGGCNHRDARALWRQGQRIRHGRHVAEGVDRCTGVPCAAVDIQAPPARKRRTRSVVYVAARSDGHGGGTVHNVAAAPVLLARAAAASGGSGGRGGGGGKCARLLLLGALRRWRRLHASVNAGAGLTDGRRHSRRGPRQHTGRLGCSRHRQFT